MPIWMKAVGKWGGLLVIIALVITLLKQIIALIGFLTGAIKILIILLFILLIVGVGLMVLRGFRESRRTKE